MFLNKKNNRHRMPNLVLFISLFISIVYNCAHSAQQQQQQQDVNQPIRVRIFSMRIISVQQAKDYLTKAQITNSAVAIPGTNAISVTASPEKLVYAGNVLKIVDSNELYDVKFIDIDSEKLPANQDIEAKLGRNFSVGTLLEGTGTTPTVKLIIDRYDDEMMIIAPAVEMEALINLIKELSTETKPKIDKIIDGNTGIQAEPNQLMSPLPESVKEVNAIPEEEKQAPSIDVDSLNEFMTELAEGAKADKEAARLKPQTPEVTTDSEFIKPIEPQVAEKTLETEKVILNEEANKTVEELMAQQKGPAINEMDIPNGDEVLELNLPEKLEIVTLIDLVGRYLNLNYLYDETKVTGSVTVKVQGRIRVRELYSLLESVLKFRNFSMSRKGNLVTIVPISEALDQDPVLVDGTVKPGDVAVTKVFRLKYINTAAAKKLLTEMKLGSSITEIPEIGTVVITEYAFRMQRIEDLLNLVDVPGPPKEFKLRVLKYTLAESLVQKIQALAEQLGTIDITIGTSTAQPTIPGRITRTPRPITPPGAIPGQTTESTSKGVFVDFDKRTNRVLMIGLPAELESVDKIIDSLDVPQQDLRIISEYEIQFIDINKIVEALKELNIIQGAISTSGQSQRQTITRPGGEGVPQPMINPAVSESGTGGAALLDQPQVVMLESTNSLLVNATPEQHIQISQIIAYIDREPIQTAIPYKIYRLENQDPEDLAETLNGLIGKTVTDAEGKIQQSVKYTEENIVIVPDLGTFSLIVYASRKNQEWIGSLIQSLDVRRPQVLIDVSLVEITRDDKFQYDLDVVANATDLVENSLVINGDAINTRFPASSPSDKLFEGGFFAPVGSDQVARGFFNAGRIQVLLDLIDKNQYGRVLARPKVLVNDNEEGTISTEDVTYIAQTTTTIVPGVDTPQTSTTFTPYTAKIELKITPQISEGSLLRLEIEMQRNDFQDTAGSTGGPPDEKKSNVNTIVTVPDGSTIILGGLTKLNQDKTTNKVPLLGDIPVAGTLFRSAGKTAVDSKLYIFVKANILRPEDTLGMDQLKEISRKNRVEFEEAETKFQKFQLFPGVEEKPIDPERVLEQ
ncbi:MAG: hypothetical protein A2Y10_02055 [Planctomycetes bacterium GWF2_41_51]|nr:MAG: hypothetical protein A2Y10_02055 [Planctomycetes bacterium GWF2_41_51]